MTSTSHAGASGALCLLEAAAKSGAEICFANPGTTEMPLVAAFDAVPAIRPVLCLFEGVCTGAADGWGRMRGSPALTLLHLGPGFANGIANLHNARRAHTPIVNIVGDHASWHLKYDAPLTSDIESLARPVSVWYRKSASAEALPRDTTAAIEAAIEAPGVATLVAPIDFQRSTSAATQHGAEPASTTVSASGSVPRFDAAQVEVAARHLRSRKSDTRTVILVGGRGLSERGQRAAGRIASATGCGLYSETFPARAERGGGLPDLDRLPYFPEPAIAALSGATVILAGALAPVAYFGYEGLPSELAPKAMLLPLATPAESADFALEALAEAIGAPQTQFVAPIRLSHIASSEALTPLNVGLVLAASLPDGAVVSIEGGTCGYPFVTASAAALRHTILTNTGGAIGQGLPVALGAAAACPDRRVFALQSDGSAQYTIQALWTMAHEKLPVVMLIASNRRYGILQTELRRDISGPAGKRAARLTLLDDPPFDWSAIAHGYGVESIAASTTAELQRALDAGSRATEPLLIEMRLP